MTDTSTVQSSPLILSTQAPGAVILPDLAGIASAPAKLPINDGMSTLYATSEAAHSVIGTSGQFLVISAKKNNTKGAGVDDGWQAHCVVPSFASDIASLGEWMEMVNTTLLKQASDTLKQFRTANPMAGEIPISLFTAAQLREDYLSGGDTGSMTKEELEKAFCNSATWKRITTSDKWKQSGQYRTIADVFKNKVVALAGRSQGSITDSDLDKILAKIEEDDFATQFGAFVIRKIQKIKKDRMESDVMAMDIDAL